MIFLLLFILLATSFVQLFRLAQVRGGRLPAIGMINYLMAALGSAAWWWSQGHASPQYQAVALGLLNGVLYLLHLSILLRSMKLAGVGLTTAVTNTSGVVPILVGLLLWSHPVSPAQWCAVAVMPVALVLMRRGSDPANPAPHLSAAADLWLLASMLMQGVIQTIHKAAQQSLELEQQPVYNVCLFAAAAVTGFVWMMHDKAAPRPRDWTIGIVIGTVNATTLVVMLLGLARLPSATFFTIAGTALMALNVVTGRWLWGERMLPRHYAGLALAMCVVMLAQWR
jgi:drug/metabolite transporter (DMT)-like permease